MTALFYIAGEKRQNSIFDGRIIQTVECLVKLADFLGHIHIGQTIRVNGFSQPGQAQIQRVSGWSQL